MNLVKDKDTKLTYRFPRASLKGVDAFLFSNICYLNSIQFFQGMRNAEKEGFDAVIQTCYYDPMLREMRQTVDIPVVGAAETSMLLATMMGAKFGVVTVSPEASFTFEQNIATYGLSRRAVKVLPIPLSADEQATVVVNASGLIEAFKEVAKTLIYEGAEVLIPGSGTLAPAIRMAPGAEDRYPNGLTQVDGVPVMDVISCLIKTAENFVSLKQAGSCWISRKGFYKQPTSKALEQATDILSLNYDSPGWWDYSI